MSLYCSFVAAATYSRRLGGNQSEIFCSSFLETMTCNFYFHVLFTLSSYLIFFFSNIQHAYYLDYQVSSDFLHICDASFLTRFNNLPCLHLQNRRPDYISIFMENLVSWDSVSSRLESAKAGAA